MLIANRKSARSSEKQIQKNGEARRIEGIVTASLGRPDKKKAYRLEFGLLGIHEQYMQSDCSLPQLPDALNTSNLRVHNSMTCAAREECPSTKAYYFVDIRDIALCHVLAAEKKEAAGKPFLFAADKLCNNQIAEITGEKFPQLRGRWPTGEALKTGDFPATGMPGFDNSRSVEALRITCSSLAESIANTVKSLQGVEES
ncbi:methylglyoxal reductase (NADPH-dependent) gre2 [Sticta canariensis]|nr:methylglyoxal reductase (NADPH-dependent) gre2 [Sticta canariensis]